MINTFKNINAYELRRFIKVILLLLAVLISILTLFLSQRLVQKIAVEETKKMEIWADAERVLSDPNSEGDLGFHLKIVQSNETIPAILVSESDRIIQYINLTEKEQNNDIIQFGMFGKLEPSRKRHLKILTSWVKKYGNKQGYMLNCNIFNRFLDPNMQSQLITQALNGQKYWNIN